MKNSAINDIHYLRFRIFQKRKQTKLFDSLSRPQVDISNAGRANCVAVGIDARVS